jgi:HlyD family secretion protein
MIRKVKKTKKSSLQLLNLYSQCLILLAFVLLTACNNKKNQADATGVFETKEIIVSAKGSGEIMNFNVEEGETIKAFDLLGYIDTTQLYLKKLQLEMNSKAIRNQFVDIQKQTAALEQQIVTAQTEKTRIVNLLKSEAATSKQLDDINAQISMLEKQLEATKTSMQQSNSGVEDTKSGVAVQIAQINDQIKNSIIQSPIDGTILTKYAEQGELAMQGRPLFKVADLNNMYLRAYITASQLTELKIGQQVKVFSDMGKSDRREYQGTVTWISDKAEFTPKTIQTRDERANLVYAVKILVKNDGYIKKGMYGELIINN